MSFPRDSRGRFTKTPPNKDQLGPDQGSKHGPNNLWTHKEILLLLKEGEKKEQLAKQEKQYSFDEIAQAMNKEMEKHHREQKTKKLRRYTGNSVHWKLYRLKKEYPDLLKLAAKDEVQAKADDASQTEGGESSQTKAGDSSNTVANDVFQDQANAALQTSEYTGEDELMTPEFAQLLASITTQEQFEYVSALVDKIAEEEIEKIRLEYEPKASS